MRSAREQRAESLFNSALGRSPGERATFVDAACGSDVALKQEVLSLLEAYADASGFLQSPPAAGTGGHAPDPAPRRLTAGTRMGHYEVLAPIAAGGMGEVYRARDVRLDRHVALKVLAPSLSRDPRSRERFRREAITCSKLAHPRICTLHDIGQEGDADYLVMELLQGETLAARLARGRPSVAEAVQWGTQIADALVAAHAHGVIHRDLKPANVMLTAAGIKLLDFGLALLREPGPALTDGPPPTVGRTLTSRGLVVGTLPYMAPEQVRGEVADARTDVFAFGAVLYEMLSGARAFAASSQAALIAAILEHPPAPLAGYLPAVSPALNRLVETCLAKDPDDRWQTMRDVARELQWTARAEAAAVPPAVPPAVRGPRGAVASSHGRRLVSAVAGAAAGAAVTAAVILWPTAASPPLPVRFTVASRAGAITFPVLSPDGRHLAYVAGGTVWSRSLDGLDERAVPGTEGVSVLSWLGQRWLGLGTERQGGVIARPEVTRVVGLDGTPVGRVEGRCGMAQRTDGALLVGGHGIRFAAAVGAPLVDVIPPNVEEHRCWPTFLPDGRRFLFTVWSAVPDRGGLHVGEIGRADSRRLLVAPRAVYVSTGHLLYTRGTQLVAHAFDPEQARLLGEPRVLAEDVEVDATLGYGHFTVVGGEVLAYRTRAAPRQQYMQWRDRAGREVGVIRSELGSYSQPAIAPDGRRVALTRTTGERQDIWIVEAGRGVDARLTYGKENQSFATWSPDGTRVMYSGSRTVYESRADGTGTPVERPTFVPGRPTVPNDRSPDGRVTLYQVADFRWSSDLWAATAEGEPTRLVGTHFDEGQAAFSPDGRWFAYTSDESGVYEVYVQSYPLGRGKWRVSTAGGTQPRWRRDGSELFYVSGTGMLTGVAVTSGSSLDFGPPVALFPTGLQHDAWGMLGRDYDVMPDGQRFLVRALGPQPDAPLVVVTDWPALLDRR